MNIKKITFCFILGSTYIFSNAFAQTQHTKEYHNATPSLSVSQTHKGSKQSSNISSSLNNSISISADEKAYIDSLPLTEHTKKLLYDFAMTPEGQINLLQMTNVSLVGPTGSSISTPVAFAADWGILAAGATVVDHWPTGHKSDGFAGLTMGLGDAQQYAGLSVSALIDNLGGGDNRFAQNGTVAAQLFHIFPHDFAVGFGVANILPWGKAFQESSRNYYAVATKVFDSKIKTYSMPLTVSLGGGTGSFYSYQDITDKRDSRVKPFGSIGWRVLPRASLIGEWVANQASTGISVVPFKSLPLVLNAAYANINRYQNTKSYFTVSAAIGYSFK